MLRILIILILISLPAYAADAPVPARKTGTLDQLRKELNVQKEQKEKIGANLKTAEKDFKETKEKLIETAKSIRDSEDKLLNLENSMTALTAEEAQIQSTLQSDYGSLATLILALERMRRLPPELLIVRPGAPLETAQTATLLKSLLPSLGSRTQELSSRLKRMAEIRSELNRDREAAVKTRESLRRDYKNLSSLTEKRERIYKDLNKDYAQTQVKIDKIARETKSMEEFMERLAAQQAAEERRIEEERKRAERENRPRPAATASWAMPKAGRPQLPVSGAIVTNYGKEDEIGAISKGVTLRAAPSAIVVSPMGGIVKFSGDFLHYGRMVIIEHPKGYHSLIAGFEDISVNTGLSIGAGEPVGKLPAASSRGEGPTLYYELRFKGQPVDPARTFSDLRS